MSLYVRFIYGSEQYELPERQPVLTEDDVGETLHARVERLEYERDVWKSKASMPSPNRLVAVVFDDYNRSLNVTNGILCNGGDRISFGRALQDVAEMKRLQAALIKAYPQPDEGVADEA